MDMPNQSRAHKDVAWPDRMIHPLIIILGEAANEMKSQG